MITSIAALAIIGQGDSATPIKIGQRAKASLEKSTSKDFTISLPKGKYRIIADCRNSQDGSTVNVAQASVKLLKQNGSTLSEFSDSFMSWYEYEPEYREVRDLTVSKNSGFRFRIKNSDLSQSDIYLTVVPAAPATFTPFAFGTEVREAQIGENGIGGSIDFLGVAYQRVTLKPGKWSISLGMTRDQDSKGYVAGTLKFLNQFGGPTTIDGLKIDSAEGGREEKILDIKKTSTFILRAKNISNNRATLKYDITVRPSTDSKK